MKRNFTLPLRKDDGEISQDQVEIANILNKCFQDVFIIEDQGELPHFDSCYENCTSPFTDLLPDLFIYLFI